MHKRSASGLSRLLRRLAPPIALSIAAMGSCLSATAIAADKANIGAAVSDRLKKQLADFPLRPEEYAGTLVVIVHSDQADVVQSVVQAERGRIRYRYRDMIEIEVPRGRLGQVFSTLPRGTVARLPYPHIFSAAS